MDAVLWERLVEVPAFVPDDAVSDPAVEGLRRAWRGPTRSSSAPRSAPARCRAASRTPSTGWSEPGSCTAIRSRGSTSPRRAAGGGAEATLSTVLGYVDADVV